MIYSAGNETGIASGRLLGDPVPGGLLTTGGGAGGGR